MRNRFCSLFLAALLAGCHSPQTEGILLTGRIVGSDGQPMKLAHVSVDGGDIYGRLVVQADPDGSYEIDLPGPGAYSFYGMGVHHETVDAPLIIDSDEYLEVEFNVMLSGIDFAFDRDSVFVEIGGNEDSRIQLLKDSDGSYSTNIGDIPSETSYQIVLQDTAWTFKNFPKPRIKIAGNLSGSLHADTTGRFWDQNSEYSSVSDFGESKRMSIFSPASLPEKSQQAEFSSSTGLVADIATIYQDVELIERKIGRSYRESNFIYDVDVDKTDYQDRIKKEESHLIRDWLLMRYFDEMSPQKSDSTMAEYFVNTVSPTSMLWSYEGLSSVGVWNNLMRLRLAISDTTLLDSYLTEIIQENEDPKVLSQAIALALSFANAAGDELSKSLYYDRLVTEFPESDDAVSAKRLYSPQRVIRVGEKLPEYVFFSLDDESLVLNNERYKGQVYLMDFWGTWCGPCVQEIPAHQNAVDKYSDEGFTIISAAFLDTKKSVLDFRKEKFPMDWDHVLVNRSEDSEVREEFEIVSFPRYILVDEDGIVIAQNEELRRGKLDEILAEHFGSRASK